MRCFSILISVTLLAACGGGGGGGGNAPAPPRTGIPESYYPVSTGSRWTYDVTSSTAGSYVDDMVVAGSRVISGANAWVFSESNPAGDGMATESYYRKDLRAFTYLGQNLYAPWLDALISPLDLMRFDGTFSASTLLSRNNVDLGLDLDGDGMNERADVVVSGTVEGYETLVNDLGSFSNTARLRYDISGTIRLSTGESRNFTETLREWRAPELGSLRQSIDSNVAGITHSDHLEARGLTVNGIAAGILAPRDLMTNLADADSDTTLPGQAALASDGANYIVVSNRMTPSGPQRILQILDQAGQAKGDPELIAVTDIWGSPSVAWNGANYLLVTWGGSVVGMQGQLVSRDGSVGLGKLLASDGYNRAIASGGDKWLVVYARTAIEGSLFGRFIDSAGNPSNEFTVATGVANATPPALAFNGHDFMVVWVSRSTPTDPSTSNIYATRVSPDGAFRDAVPFSITTAAEAQWWPQVACGLPNCLVTWVDRRNYPGQSYNYSPGPGDIYGVFVSQGGEVQSGPPDVGGIPIALGLTANAGHPALAYSGSDYLAAWSSGAFVNSPGGPTGVYAARISPEGVVTTRTGGVPVSGEPEAATIYVYPALAASSSGVLAVWLKNRESAGASKSIAGTVVWPRVSR
ncbi:hypothetical protein [Rhodoferax lacus]|nr:hypothetical protein [Rhodoferax lacus]